MKRRGTKLADRTLPSSCVLIWVGFT